MFKKYKAVISRELVSTMKSRAACHTKRKSSGAMVSNPHWLSSDQIPRLKRRSLPTFFRRNRFMLLHILDLPL
ncbi:hypothetical protein C4D60_Mb07t22150 [Musa balbisiana]|uniref:Uncharacterized protein n=1 Tax=Musa balbisiana TaxID=52838 RepID=A0A4S8JHD3_MUSBA|nr:hypothetical protein C4D60_Mb07t22150 [Musa balbisiana]